MFKRTLFTLFRKSRPANIANSSEKTPAGPTDQTPVDDAWRDSRRQRIRWHPQQCDRQGPPPIQLNTGNQRKIPTDLPGRIVVRARENSAAPLREDCVQKNHPGRYKRTASENAFGPCHRDSKRLRRTPNSSRWAVTKPSASCCG